MKGMIRTKSHKIDLKYLYKKNISIYKYLYIDDHESKPAISIFRICIIFS